MHADWPQNNNLQQLPSSWVTSINECWHSLGLFSARHILHNGNFNRLRDTSVLNLKLRLEFATIHLCGRIQIRLATTGTNTPWFR
jgi:hypothetical protein